MTPSFDRGEAGRAYDVGRTDGAARAGRGCPISNLFAGVISHPKSSSNGPAVLTCIFPPQGQLIHPGLVSLPGSQSVLETLGPILLPVGEPRGGALSPDRRRRTFSRENLSLTLRDQPASDAPREGSDVRPGVRFHVPNMEVSNAEDVAPAYVKERG